MEQKEQYRIHPAIGIGRLGNSPASYYLAPEKIGGLPIEPDENGDPIIDSNGQPKYVSNFKDGTRDSAGKIRRQAAKFQVYRTVDGKEVPVDVNDSEIETIKWTVHVANKKGAWWEYIPLLGNLMFGKLNSYDTWADNPSGSLPQDWNLPDYTFSGLPWMAKRNSFTDAQSAQQFIIDPGPRTLELPKQKAHFDNNTDYKHVSFPDPKNIVQGRVIKTLGEMRTDSKGNLLVLGGFGYSGGNTSVSGFGGGAGWYDDISDGPVTATIYFKDKTRTPIELKAWVVMGSPKFAPELVNISTWDDVAADAAIKYMNARPDIYDNNKWAGNSGWNPEYIVNYDKDVKVFLDRIADYQWVAVVPSMTAFIRPAFNPYDASEANMPQRKKFLSYFRKSSTIRQATEQEPAGFNDDGQTNQLFSDYTVDNPAGGIPLMPVNSGTNSVRNNVADKFSVLTDTQYYCLEQWANGKFSATAPGIEIEGVHALDRAAIGNCVGEPMCPGIEVTWNVRNPVIYDQPYVIKHRHTEEYYAQNGLDPFEDECLPEQWIGNEWTGFYENGERYESPGCEPGDLTKRMAIPWQADFMFCSVQFINFTVNDNKNNNENKNNVTGIPTPPSYFSYWWPPQSPFNVIAGGTNPEEQKADVVPPGTQVLYARGVNSIGQMMTEAWAYLGFIVNQNKDPEFGRQYPYFVEKERNYEKFNTAAINVGASSNYYTGEDTNWVPAWFLKEEDQQETGESLQASTASKFGTGRRQDHDTPKKLSSPVRVRFGRQ